MNNRFPYRGWTTLTTSESLKHRPLVYYPQLDGLRGVAILLVYAHHGFSVPFFWSGVDLFFILSGYLITSILLRDRERMGLPQALKSFYIRRAQRIIPGYLICLGLIAAFTHVVWRRLWVFYACFLQNIPYAFGWIKSGPLVPMWSLSVEQQFYLFWPLLVFAFDRRTLARCLFLVLLLVPLLRFAVTPLFSRPEVIYSITIFRLDAIAAGALAAIWLPQCNPKRSIRWSQIVLAFGVIVLITLHPYGWFRRSSNTPAGNALIYSINILIYGAFFVWTLLSEKGFLRFVLASAPMRALGRISYTFYLLHVLVITLLAQHLKPVSASAVGLILTTALAGLSWFYIEKPILSLQI